MLGEKRSSEEVKVWITTSGRSGRIKKDIRSEKGEQTSDLVPKKDEFTLHRKG